jgi:hypothetical protein
MGRGPLKFGPAYNIISTARAQINLFPLVSLAGIWCRFVLISHLRRCRFTLSLVCHIVLISHLRWRRFTLFGVFSARFPSGAGTDATRLSLDSGLHRGGLGMESMPRQCSPIVACEEEWRQVIRACRHGIPERRKVEREAGLSAVGRNRTLTSFYRHARRGVWLEVEGRGGVW